MFVIIIWTILANFLAYRKKFYQLPKEGKKETLVVSAVQLISCFGIYLVLAIIIAPFFAQILLKSLHKANPQITTLPITILTGLQWLVMILIFIFMQWLMYSQDKKLLFRLWKDRSFIDKRSSWYDFGFGALTWFLSFPTVTVIGETIDYFLKSVLKLTYYEQTAVKFVKLAMGSPVSLFFALFSVLLLAPFIEEFLFRGILLTFLKKYLGGKSALLLSALCFALFHFSFGQGIGNLSLIISLFILGCYLGLLYQKQKSLWAPIGLHMLFNIISALRIIFFPEAS